MKRMIFSILVFCGMVLLANDFIYAAHILEPLGTEIAATPPRGRMFGEVKYAYIKDDPDDSEEITSHVLGFEFEIGVGERTQLNLEAEVLLDEEEDKSDESESGIEEIAFGVKHRFWDETDTQPDAAFLVEVAPGAGLNNDESELKGSLLLTKNFTNKFLTHFELGYLYVTEDEEDETTNTNNVIYNIAPIFRIIPDKFLLVAELNGLYDFDNDISDVSLSPEIIYVFKKTALKFRTIFGLSDEADDFAIEIGISKLF